MGVLEKLRRQVQVTVGGETLTVTVRKIGMMDVLGLVQRVPSLYSDLVPSDAREAIKVAAEAENEAEKAAQGLAIAYAIVVAGTVDPQLCLRPSADCLSPSDLEDVSAETPEDRLRPILTIAEAIAELSGLEGLFRGVEKAEPKKAPRAKRKSG